VRRPALQAGNRNFPKTTTSGKTIGVIRRIPNSRETTTPNAFRQKHRDTLYQHESYVAEMALDGNRQPAAQKKTSTQTESLKSG